ncbi:MAG: thioredoxin family protein [Proteobacteria bacterium]|nr:thioredoxin family protein [Pseudomonadota bacterium]
MRVLLFTVVTVTSAAVLILATSTDVPVAGAESVAYPGARPNPKELGWVAWGRDYDRAAALSARTGKPIFLLFQEVPGCRTCVGFGETVLAHPLVVEAIESEFVPLAIHNNKGGADAAVLARFSEPSWNNPVVRFVDAAGRDLVLRADRVWTTAAIAGRMVAALEAAGRPAPDYLRWVIEETTASTRTATFAMHCYWTGEACLGDIDGVVATRAGWLDGREVVEVEYDRARISEQTLRSLAGRRDCGEFVATASRAREAGARDRKYHLQRSTWNHVPLTPRQAARVNAAVRQRRDPSRWVSPRQRALHAQIARALAKRRNALAKLHRPDEVSELARYQFQLRAKLAQVLGNDRGATTSGRIVKDAP